MHRRLGTLLALCCLVATAGCLGGATGPLHPPSGPADEYVATATPDGGGSTPDDGRSTPEPTPQAVKIPDFDFAEGVDGNVVVELSVENTGNETRTVDLVAAIEVNGTLEEAAETVTLEPGQRTTVGVQFDGAWENFTPNLAYARVRPAGEDAR